jgi:hypothetical protein
LIYFPASGEERANVREYISRQIGAGYNFRGVIKLGLYAIGVVPSWSIFADVLICFILLAAIVPLKVTIPLRLLVLIAMLVYTLFVIAKRLRKPKEPDRRLATYQK